jgi:prepilin-type N-terminal cleavage/methylation domain-containing protein
MRRGFSLVELSIVLVILGLLVGGILAGQSLIRASELRAVGAEYTRWVTATQAFRDKYFALPGDMTNATRFWGRQNGNADCVSNSGAGTLATGACDGDGNGIVPWDNVGAVSTAREMHQFWRQLSLAGLIPGEYSGLAGPTNNSADVRPGTNSPISKLNNAGWGMGGAGNCGVGAQCYYASGSAIYQNYFALGALVAAGGNVPVNPVMKPEEAWNIDTKMDDGMPATGKIMPRWTALNQCTTSTSNSDTAGLYNVGSNTILCSLYFVRVI